MEERIKVLTSVETYVNLQWLLESVKALTEKQPFETLPKSNVRQYRKEEFDNCGVWGSIIGAANRVEGVKKLKQDIVALFKKSKMLHGNIKWDEIKITALYTEGDYTEKQDPHTDYDIMKAKSPDELAWTAHLPLNKNEGSYLYVWAGPGCGTAVHVKGGQCLLHTVVGYQNMQIKARGI
jgi:hypothetical protein